MFVTAKTEEVIGSVLDEIAKYTIGDADGDEDLLFNEDWMSNESSASDGEILGEKILYAVQSTAQLPNLPPASPKFASIQNNTTKSATENDTLPENKDEIKAV